MFLVVVGCLLQGVGKSHTGRDKGIMISKAVKITRPQRRLSDLVGIDFSTTGTKLVRLKRNKSGLTLAGIDLLPPVDFGSAAEKINLPRDMSANYGCLAYSGLTSVMRMVNTPLEATVDIPAEDRLRELLSVGDDFRVGAQLITRGKGAQDSSLLAAAIPQDDVKFLLNMFLDGPPAPVSIEVAGLSFITAFLHACGAQCENEAICLIEAGESVTNFAFLNKGKAVLVGKMGFGANSLRTKLASDLGVDEELATSILNDQSINISTSMTAILGPFLKQLSISKDFIERHMGCRVGRVFVSGGMSLLPNWSSEVGKILHVEVDHWNPLENIRQDPGVVSADLEKQLTRFSAAIGAAIGGFELA